MTNSELEQSSEDAVALDINDPTDAQISESLLEIVPFIMRRIRNEMKTLAKKDLTIAQLRILSKLYHDNSTVSELADHHGVSAPAMSKMISNLERRELIERSHETADRRQVSIVLTKQGR